MRYLADGKGLSTHRRTVTADMSRLNRNEWEAEGNVLYLSSGIRSDRLPWLKTRELMSYKTIDTSISNGFGYLGNKFYYVSSNALSLEGIQDSFYVGSGKKYFKHFGGRIYIFPNGTYFDPLLPAVISLFRSVKGVTVTVSNYIKDGVDCGLSKLTCEGQSFRGIFYAGDCLRVTSKSTGGVSVHRVMSVESDGGVVLEPMAFGSGVSFSAEVDMTNGAVEADCVGCVCEERVWFASGTHIYATGYGGGRWTDERRCSFACEIESGEQVVACEELNGYPVFFTEKSIYVMRGNNSSDFALERCECRGGITSDMSHTLTRVLGHLYYVTPHGLARFDGERSELLDGVPFDIASYKLCLGTDSKNLFVSLSPDGYGELYAYDIVHGQWKKTGLSGISYIFSEGARAYGYSMLDRIYKLSDGTNISGVGGYTSETTVIYRAEFVFDIGGDMPYRIRVDGDIDANGSCTVYASYDRGESGEIGCMLADESTHNVMLIPRACDKLKVTLYGARSACIRGVYVDVTT